MGIFFFKVVSFLLNFSGVCKYNLTSAVWKCLNMLAFLLSLCLLFLFSIYLACVSLRLLSLWHDVFYCFLEKFDHYLFKYFFCLILFSLSSIPIKCLDSLFLLLLLFVSLCVSVWLFLLTYLQVYWFFPPQLCQIYYELIRGIPHLCYYNF